MRQPVDIMRLSASLGELLWEDSQTEQLPWLALPEGFAFKSIFPFSGAAARFLVCKTSKPERSVSVYLDTRSVLGCLNVPYWEAYPIGGDTQRFFLDEGDQLIGAIVNELNSEAP